MRNVLIAGVGAADRDMLRTALAGDYEVLEAENAASALTVLQQTDLTISAVLLDTAESAADGFAALQMLLSNAGQDQPPIIAITDGANADSAARALTLGACDFIAKPFQVEVMLHRLKSVISSRENAADADLAGRLQAIMDNISGGVVVSDMQNGSIEILFANNRYYELIGYSKEEYTQKFRNNSGPINADDAAWVLSVLEQVLNTGEARKLEFRERRGDGTEIWVRDHIVRLNLAAFARPVLLSVLYDITEEKRLERTEQEQAEQLLFLGEISRNLLAEPDAERSIRNTLQKLLHYFDGNRAYIFEFNYERQTVSNTYEVCAEDVSREKENLQELSIELFPFWVHAFDEQSYISIADVDALPDERAEKSILVAQNIKSLMAVPLRRSGKYIGFMGVDDARQSYDQVNHLAVLGDYFTVILTRRDYEARLAESAGNLAQMMQDMPGGYVKMQITNTGVIPVFFNDEFCRLCGMSLDDAKELYRCDAFAGIHPDDAEFANAIIGEAIRNRTTVSLRIRFTNGHGGYIPLQTFYRVTEDAAGSLFLNGYYSDATALNRFEAQRRELLENLPCGAGIYEITKTGIRATYLNKQYRAYLRREIGDLRVAPVFGVVHPDDIDVLKEELGKAFTGSSMGACDIRIMDGVGGYIPFRVTGKVMEQTEDKTVLYVIYVPISDAELLLQKRAQIDGMTGVYNKLTTEELIKHKLAVSINTPCAMLIADVDDLKMINDTLGHPQGDRAICMVADALKAQFRRTDIVGRIGGDEFIVFLEGVGNEEKLREMVQSLFGRLEDGPIGDQDDVPMYVSIGVAVGETGGLSFDDLYACADKALYSAKNNGKNQYAMLSV